MHGRMGLVLPSRASHGQQLLTVTNPLGLVQSFIFFSLLLSFTRLVGFHFAQDRERADNHETCQLNSQQYVVVRSQGHIGLTGLQHIVRCRVLRNELRQDQCEDHVGSFSLFCFFGVALFCLPSFLLFLFFFFSKFFFLHVFFFSYFFLLLWISSRSPFWRPGKKSRLLYVLTQDTVVDCRQQ